MKKHIEIIEFPVVKKAHQDTITKYQITTTQEGADTGIWEWNENDMLDLVRMCTHRIVFTKGDQLPHAFVPILELEQLAPNKWIATITERDAN